MKVVFIYPGPYPYGPKVHRKTRAHLLFKGLIENNVDVLMLLTQPTENRNKIYNQPRGNFEGVNYEYIGGNNIRSENIIKRQLVKIKCIFLLFYNIIVNYYKADIIVLLGASFDYRILIPIIGRLCRIKTILEINEFPLVNRENTFIVKIKRYILFNIIFPLYNGFIPISSSLNDLISIYKKNKAQTIIIPIIGENILNTSNTEIKKGIPYIFHAGSLLENKDGVLGMISAFGIAKNKITIPIRFILTGKLENTPQQNKIKEIIDKFDLSKDIVFTGFLSDKEIDRYFRSASLAIINKNDNIQNRYCFASKISDYLAYSIPVITTRVGEVEHYFIDGVNSYLVNPNDHQDIAKKIIRAFSDENERKMIGENGKKLFDENFDYRVQGIRLSQFFLELG
jgi:glycosyltransferase involved in cell wall biosynthesis